MIEQLIAALEKKGIKDARAVVMELVEGGALTGFHASKYLARDKVLTIVSKETMSTTRVIEDVAFEYHMCKRTLQTIVAG